MAFASRLAAATLAAMLCGLVPASAQAPAPQPPPRAQPGPDTFGPDEILGAGHKFFGNVSRGLASVIERAVSQWGLPNGYVLGEEGSGAFVAGFRYGEGTPYTKNARDLHAYRQGPGGRLARRRRPPLHQECGRSARLLAGSVGRLRLGRRRRAHHDAGL